MHSEELPSDLRAAFGALPREAPLVPGEEDRTVWALRRQGFMHPPRWRRWTVVGGQIAAALALFAGGALYGGERAQRRALEAQLAQRDRDAQTAALLVQRAGSAYVEAVVRLAAASQGASSNAALASGREAALTSMRAAAGELARMGVRLPGPAPAAQPTVRVYSF